MPALQSLLRPHAHGLRIPSGLMKLVVNAPLGLAILIAGCGEETPSGATASESSGIPLAISGPDTEISSDIRAQDTPAEPIPGNDQILTPLIKKARQAVVARRPTIAIEALSQAIALAPENAELLRMRADVYASVGENASARADFSMALRVDPKNPDLYNVRGFFLMGQGILAEARQDFEQAIELRPDHSRAWNNLGLVSLAESNFEQAVNELTHALEHAPNYADAWNNRGFSRMKNGQLNEALADLRKATELNPQYITAWNNVGLCSLRNEEPAEAVDAFSKAIELAPLDVRWYNHRRAALLELEDFEAAAKDEQKIVWLQNLAALTELTQQRPGDPAAWLRRAAFLADGSHYGAAIQDYTRSLVLQPGNPEALTGRARAWYAAGDFQKCLLDCDEAVVAGGGTDARSLRGEVFLELGRLDQAIADFEAGGRMDNDVESAYRERSRKYQEEGETTLAEADLQKANAIRQALDGAPVADQGIAPELPPSAAQQN